VRCTDANPDVQTIPNSGCCHKLRQAKSTPSYAYQVTAKLGGSLRSIHAFSVEPQRMSVQMLSDTERI
jgi:hypothetical protein